MIALGLTDVVLMVALPQRFAPWRPPALVRLADDTGAPSQDGASVAVSMVALAAEAAVLLEPASGYTFAWGADRLWPSGADLRVIDYRPSTIVSDGVNLAEATSGRRRPPKVSQRGALFMEWPPPEPEDAEERPMPLDDSRSGPHGPEGEFVTTGDEGGSRAGTCAAGPALPQAARDTARAGPRAAEGRAAVRRPPTPRGQADGSCWGGGGGGRRTQGRMLEDLASHGAQLVSAQAAMQSFLGRERRPPPPPRHHDRRLEEASSQNHRARPRGPSSGGRVAGILRPASSRRRGWLRPNRHERGLAQRRMGRVGTARARRARRRQHLGPCPQHRPRRWGL